MASSSVLAIINVFKDKTGDVAKPQNAAARLPFLLFGDKYIRPLQKLADWQFVVI